jgi:hypothetical protein
VLALEGSRGRGKSEMKRERDVEGMMKQEKLTSEDAVNRQI